MSGKPDVIRWVIDWMMTNEAAVTEDMALRCERAARAEWGGQRVDYIAKTCSTDREQRRSLQGRTAPATERAAVADYLANKPIAAIETAHGINRRTLYRMLKR